MFATVSLLSTVIDAFKYGRKTYFSLEYFKQLVVFSFIVSYHQFLVHVSFVLLNISSVFQMFVCCCSCFFKLYDGTLFHIIKELNNMFLCFR